jgi:hypothetical protein
VSPSPHLKMEGGQISEASYSRIPWSIARRTRPTAPVILQNNFIHTDEAVTGRGGPYDSETSSLLHFLINQLTDGAEDVSLRAGPSVPQRRLLVPVSVRD